MLIKLEQQEVEAWIDICKGELENIDVRLRFADADLEEKQAALQDLTLYEAFLAKCQEALRGVEEQEKVN